MCDLTDFPTEYDMQRVIRMTGVLTPCPSGHQPKLVEQWGKPLFFLECCPCAVRTAKFPTAQEAVAAWEAQETVSQARAA